MFNDQFYIKRLHYIFSPKVFDIDILFTLCNLQRFTGVLMGFYCKNDLFVCYIPKGTNWNLEIFKNNTTIFSQKVGVCYQEWTEGHSTFRNSF